jgi:ATP-binding cassette subfamily C protein/ATP-binding cassette subfamily C protein EexD
MLQGFARSARMVLQIAITGFGAYLTLQNEMTAGGLIAGSILISRAIAPFEGMIMLWKQLVQARDAYHRLEMLFREAPLPLGDTAMPVPRGALNVEALYYVPPKKPAVLNGITFKIEPGDMLGVIGPSAAGKTTLSKMLMGVLPPNSGHVRLDGVDVHQWAREDFGKYAGYLPQVVELFPGTIKQNIARMQQTPDDAGVIEAAQRAQVHELILQLPSGYDTVYVPGVSVLSPGQKQRIGLARALYGTPKYLVLDEPNSNLDGDGERALMATLQWLKQQRITTVIVAHRPSILTMVDKILMLRAGMLEAIGPREEMMQRYSGNARKPETREFAHGG